MLQARSLGSGECAWTPGVNVAKRTERAQLHSWPYLDKPVFDNAAEVQMLFRRIHPPMQQCKEERRQTAKRCESGKDLPEATGQGCVRRGRTR